MVEFMFFNKPTIMVVNNIVFIVTVHFQANVVSTRGYNSSGSLVVKNMFVMTYCSGTRLLSHRTLQRCKVCAHIDNNIMGNFTIRITYWCSYHRFPLTHTYFKVRKKIHFVSIPNIIIIIIHLYYIQYRRQIFSSKTFASSLFL